MWGQHELLDKRCSTTAVHLLQGRKDQGCVQMAHARMPIGSRGGRRACTGELVVHGVDLALQRVGLAQRRDEELREALQRAPQRLRLHVKVVVGVLLRAAWPLIVTFTTRYVSIAACMPELPTIPPKVLRWNQDGTHEHSTAPG